MTKRDDQIRNETRLQRLQVGAAVVLGFTLLGVIVLRALRGNVLPAGWWRP